MLTSQSAHSDEVREAPWRALSKHTELNVPKSCFPGRKAFLSWSVAASPLPFLPFCCHQAPLPSSPFSVSAASCLWDHPLLTSFLMFGPVVVRQQLRPEARGAPSWGRLLPVFFWSLLLPPALPQHLLFLPWLQLHPLPSWNPHSGCHEPLAAASAWGVKGTGERGLMHGLDRWRQQALMGS